MVEKADRYEEQAAEKEQRLTELEGKSKRFKMYLILNYFLIDIFSNILKLASTVNLDGF